MRQAILSRTRLLKFRSSSGFTASMKLTLFLTMRRLKLRLLIFSTFRGYYCIRQLNLTKTAFRRILNLMMKRKSGLPVLTLRFIPVVRYFLNMLSRLDKNLKKPTLPTLSSMARLSLQRSLTRYHTTTFLRKALDFMHIRDSVRLLT